MIQSALNPFVFPLPTYQFRGFFYFLFFPNKQRIMLIYLISLFYELMFGTVTELDLFYCLHFSFGRFPLYLLGSE